MSVTGPHTREMHSWGVEMMSAIEEEFEIELDLAALDAEQITVLGPLSRYVAKQGCSWKVPNSSPAHH